MGEELEGHLSVSPPFFFGNLPSELGEPLYLVSSLGFPPPPPPSLFFCPLRRAESHGAKCVVCC